MDFEGAVKFLKSFVSYEDIVKYKYDEKNFDLERVKKFVRDFGIDYSNVKFVHVGGSKGKGTVSTLIASYLSKGGFKTGLFTSPYMIDITECFWIDGKIISKEKFCSYVEKLRTYLDAAFSCDLTYFEFLTVLVLQYFVEEGVEYAVLEVGLGGRKDSTNIIVPEVSVLTAVEMEHTEILGDSLDKILNEKLGILKENVPFLVGYQSCESMALIKAKLSGKSYIYFVDEMDFDLELHDMSEVKIKNGKIAYCALKLLLKDVDKECFYEVFKSVSLVGRFDVRHIDGKIVIFDMAHTEESVRNLVDSLKKNFSDKKFIFLVSVMKGKNVGAIFDLICKVADKIVVTSSHEVRGFTGSELEEFVSGVDVIVDEDCISAYKKLLKDLKRDQLLIVAGSHFLVGKILRN